MKFFLALFAVIAIAAAAPSSDDSEKAPIPFGLYPLESGVGAACECNACSAACIKQKHDGGLCYKDKCYCGDLQ